MKVELLHNTPLWVCARAIRTCWDSFEKSDTENGICGEADKALIDRVGNKNKHQSTLEALVYNFEISGVSRSVLIELTRHRIASYSVQSTRYVLSKYLKNEAPFEFEKDKMRYEKYIVLTGDENVDKASVTALELLRQNIVNGGSNDKLKYSLPECFKTRLVWTINARSLQNFLTLRSSKSALWEIRQLARSVYEALPEDHKYLFEDCMQDV